METANSPLFNPAGAQGGSTEHPLQDNQPPAGLLSAEKPAPAPFTVAFKLLPGRMGVSRTRLTAIRDEKLRRGADWDLVEGVCLLTEAATLTLAEAVGALETKNPAVDPSLHEKPAPNPSACAVGPFPTAEGCAPEGCVGADLTAPEPHSAPVSLTVTRLTMNGRILLATDGRGTYRVRVKDASKFVPRMVIPCRHVEADVYELAVRMPRQKGKW